MSETSGAELNRVPGNDAFYARFMQDFEEKDPEPELTLTEPDHWVHVKSQRGILCGGLHYPNAQVVKHVQWLGRMFAAYRQWHNA